MWFIWLNVNAGILTLLRTQQADPNPPFQGV